MQVKDLNNLANVYLGLNSLGKTRGALLIKNLFSDSFLGKYHLQHLLSEMIKDAQVII
jgi:hypothetical protein